MTEIITYSCGCIEEEIILIDNEGKETKRKRNLSYNNRSSKHLMEANKQYNQYPQPSNPQDICEDDEEESSGFRHPYMSDGKFGPGKQFIIFMPVIVKKKGDLSDESIESRKITFNETGFYDNGENNEENDENIIKTSDDSESKQSEKESSNKTSENN